MRCVLVDPYASGNLDRLKGFLGTQWDLVTAALAASDADLHAALAGADAAISQGWNRRLGDAARRLRLLQLPNAGTDAVDWSAVPAGCHVCNVYEHDTPVAEFVILSILESAIGLRGLDRGFRAGDWSVGHRAFGPRHGEVAGATLGVIGYGRIGRAIARRAAALGMAVAAVSRRGPEDDCLTWAGEVSSLREMLPRADFVVVACPLDDSTRGLIGAPELARMKATACLINIARADIVDEDALFEALQGQAIREAVIDVWWRYPAPDEGPVRPSRRPFWELPNVIMTPHVAGWSEEMLERRWRIVAANLDRLARGQPPANPVARPAETPERQPH